MTFNNLRQPILGLLLTQAIFSASADAPRSASLENIREPSNSSAAFAPSAPSKSTKISWVCTGLNLSYKEHSRILAAHPDYNGQSSALTSHENTEICLSQRFSQSPDLRLGYVNSPVACNAKGECYIFALVSSHEAGYAVVPSNQAAPLAHTATTITLTKTLDKLTLVARTGGVLANFSLSAN